MCCLFVCMYVQEFFCVCVFHVHTMHDASLQLKSEQTKCFTSDFPNKRARLLTGWARERVRLRHGVKKKPTKNYYSQNATKSLNQILVASLPPRNECELVNWSSFVRHHFKCNKTLMTLKLASASASSTFTCFCFSDVLLLCYLLWQTECVCIHLHYVFE